MRSGVGLLPALVALLCAARALAAPSTQDQDVTAVVLGFQGPGAAQARGMVVRHTTKILELIPRKRVAAAARRLGADLSTPQGRTQVARQEGVALFITGKVTGRGAATRVRVVVYGSDGTEVATRQVRVPPTAAGRRALARAAREVAQEAKETLHTTPAPPPPPPSTEADDTPPRASPARKSDEGATEPGEARVPLVTVLVGAGGRTRRADVELASGDRRRYESGIFLEIPVHLDVRPVAKGDGRAAAGFTIQADFAMAVALSSVQESTGNQVDTSAYRFAIHSGYIHPFDRGAFGVLVGYHHETFKLGDNPVLPSSTYPTLRGALTGRYDLVGPLLYTRLDAGFRYLLGLGDLAGAFGANADGLGFDAQATLGGAHASGFTYALRFTVEHAILRFDGDAADAPADKGTELGFALGAHLGWGF